MNLNIQNSNESSRNIEPSVLGVSATMALIAFTTITFINSLLKHEEIRRDLLQKPRLLTPSPLLEIEDRRFEIRQRPLEEGDEDPV
jgi:hypothetical protein